MKIKVLMKWCEINQEWFMYRKDKFVMKFPDCENMHLIFDGKLDKKNKGKFEITVREI